MLKYTLLIRCGPADGSLAHTAKQFAEALLAAGHYLDSVFFYQRGVLTANGLRVVPQDEIDITRQWQELASQYELKLNVCIAAALHQGVVDQQETSRYGLFQSNLADGFSLAGLGQLAIATASCDRMISFGAG